MGHQSEAIVFVGGPISEICGLDPAGAKQAFISAQKAEGSSRSSGTDGKAAYGAREAQRANRDSAGIITSGASRSAIGRQLYLPGGCDQELEARIALRRTAGRAAGPTGMLTLHG